MIVCGFGRMGRIVCRELRAAGRALVVIEPNERGFQEAVSAGHLAIEGSAADDENLRAAGIERATDLVALAPTLADNIAITLTARELGPRLAIQTRAECESEERKLRRAGANRIVSPFHSGGMAVATAILRPKVAEFLASTSQGGSGVALGDVRVEPGSPLEGRSLADYGRKEAAKLAFVSLEREGEPRRVPPGGAEVLRSGDHLVVAGDPAAVVSMREHGQAAGQRRSAA